MKKKKKKNKRLSKLERNVCCSNTAENPDSSFFDPDEVTWGYPGGNNATYSSAYSNSGPEHNFLPDPVGREGWRSDICLFGHMLSWGHIIQTARMRMGWKIHLKNSAVTQWGI